MKTHHRKNYNNAGHAHELTFSCYHGYPFLKAERTCQWLIDAIEKSQDKLDFDIWAYVIMPNHVHLIVHPRKNYYDISKIRRSIKSPVGQKAIQYLQDNSPGWLTKVTRQRGKKTERLFWQTGGGYDRNITEPTTLLSMIDYIHMNPVRKGLVEKAIEWKWSSASWFAGEEKVPIAMNKIPVAWLNEID